MAYNTKSNYTDSIIALSTKYADPNSDPKIIGRDAILSIMSITLLRQKKPNVLLVGEAGVGKTAVVNQLAFNIVQGECEEGLRGYTMVRLDTNALISDRSYRGEFESAVQKMLQDMSKKGTVILFIDEIHTIMNLGRMSDGQTSGFHNTLKQYMTDGFLRVIGCTTTDEVQAILGDKAMKRRFQIINAPEPSEEAVRSILKSKLKEYAQDITYTPDLEKLIYNLTKDMIGSFPDKGIDFIDFLTSFARLKGATELDNEMVVDVQKLFVQYNYVHEEANPLG